jgi:hypothetical protein
MLLESLERRDVNPTAPALRVLGAGTIGEQHHDPGEQRDVPRRQVPAPPAACQSRREMNQRSLHADGVDSRFGVRANYCVQRSAGRVPARAVSSALAGRR